MRKYIIVCLISSVLFCACNSLTDNKKDVLHYVDPTIGGVGLILEPTRPLVHLPNSMLRVHPLKKDEFDDRIGGFPLTVVSHRIGLAFAFSPVFGDGDPWDSKIVIHHQEAHPYSYEAVDVQSYDKVAAGVMSDDKIGNDYYISLGMTVKVKTAITSYGCWNIRTNTTITKTSAYRRKLILLRAVTASFC